MALNVLLSSTDHMSFEYDLFISYSSADRPWAQKLFDDIQRYNLTQPNQGMKIRCWFDQIGMDQGTEFPDQLRRAVRNSQHLVIIWSDNADRSAWVRQEKAEFRASFDSDKPNNVISAQRRLLMVLLEGDDTTEHDLQKFIKIKELGDYHLKTPANLDVPTQQAWDEMVRSVTGIKRPQREIVTIPITVVATTRNRFNRIDPDDQQANGPTLNELLTNLGITLPQVANCYGDQPMQWRPFGSQATIGSVLDNLVTDMNATLATFEIKWYPLSILGPDPAEAQKNIALLSEGLSVVVVDPLSLYESYVARRFSWLSKCFENENAVVLSPPPFLYEPLRYLRNQLRFLGMPNFDKYFDPPVPTSRRIAQCSFALTDELDIKRMLLASLGSYIPPAQATSKPAYLVMENP